MLITFLKTERNDAAVPMGRLADGLHGSGMQPSHPSESHSFSPADLQAASSGASMSLVNKSRSSESGLGKCARNSFAIQILGSISQP